MKKTTPRPAPVVDPIPLPELADVPEELSPPVYRVDLKASGRCQALSHVLAPWGRLDRLVAPIAKGSPVRAAAMDRSVRVYADGLPPRPVARGADGGAF